MTKLAAQLRHMQLYAHNAHNLCKGDTFYSDHGELGGLYGTYEGGYDDIVERTIGLGQSIDLIAVQKDALKMLEEKGTPSSFNDAFTTILGCEKELCKLLAEANEGASLGTQDLLQGMCNESEVRQYKLQQRLNKSASAESTEESKEESKEATSKVTQPKIKLLTAKA